MSDRLDTIRKTAKHLDEARTAWLLAIDPEIEAKALERLRQAEIEHANALEALHTT